MNESVLNIFRRVTNQRYLAEIDGLRFLAIIPVVLMHVRTGYLRSSNFYDADLVKDSILNKILLTGDIGVLIFFTISGFILALPFANHYLNEGKAISLKKYFIRRVTRLEPPYIITLVLFLMVHIIINGELWSDIKGNFFASLFYSHNIIYQKWSLINPVAWSLEIEIQFYILVPVLTLLFKLKKTRIRRLCISFLIVVFVVLQLVIKLPFGTLLSYGQYFITGLLLADVYVESTFLRDNSNKHYYIDLIGCSGIVLAWILDYNEIRAFHPLFFFIIFYGAFRGKWLSNFFSNPFISIIGGMCYITYLIHYPMVYLLQKFTSKLELGSSFTVDVTIQELICVAIILFVSSIAFVIIEKPFMYSNWPDKFVLLFKCRAKTKEVPLE